MLYGFSYGMASASARRSRLAKACKESYKNAFNKPCSFLSHTIKFGNAARPNTDCLAAANGICTK